MDDTEERKAYEEAAFTKSANVTDPVQDVIDLTIDILQVEVHLDRDSQDDLVFKLVWAFSYLMKSEHSLDRLGQRAETKSTIF